MKLSVLTPSFNQGAYIEKNIKSVLNQNSSNFEHIIIDGGSKDNTVSILKKYPHLKWVSEPDEGQADALNKGLNLATGDIIGWINSDDYYQEDIFQDVISHFENESIQWIIGNISFHYKTLDVIKPDMSPDVSYKSLLNNPDILRQQGVFFRRRILEEVGGWDKNYYMVMDYDLWVKLSKKYQPEMVKRNYAYFLWHDDQKSTPRNTICQIKEINLVLKNNNVPFPARLLAIKKKFLYIIKAIIKSALIALGLIDKQYANIPFSVSRKTK